VRQGPQERERLLPATHILDAYARLTPRSREAWERACRRLPGGVSSNVRFFPPYPLFMSRASGSKIYDVDGREYIDYCLAFGPVVAGHGHPRLVEAMRRELDRAGTVIFGAPTELEVALAERLSSLIPSAEMTRFTNSGTESTLHAIRIARGVTGRSRLVKFEGHYHGGHDAVLFNVDRPLPVTPSSGGMPAGALETTIVLPFNDLDALEAIEQADDVAAVIVEPIARGVFAADPVFLSALRGITARRGIVLIFDEVVTWPRVSPGGAQALLGVTPDLTALGKAIGGGLPMGAVVGRRDMMEVVSPREARVSRGSGPSGPVDPYVFHGGTYNGSPLALAAGAALLDLLAEDGVFDSWAGRAARMRLAIADLFAHRGRSVQVLGEGSLFDFYFATGLIRSLRDAWRSDLEARRALDYRLFEAGVYNSPLHRFHLSLSHTDADVDRTLAAIDASLE
jgi:glutamate-1-semialdehyde 2,1-aminomutase